MKIEQEFDIFTRIMVDINWKYPTKDNRIIFARGKVEEKIKYIANYMNENLGITLINAWKEIERQEEAAKN